MEIRNWGEKEKSDKEITILVAREILFRKGKKERKKKPELGFGGGKKKEGRTMNDSPP